MKCLTGSFGRISDDVALDGSQYHRSCFEYPAGPALFLCLDRDEQLLVGSGFCQGVAGARHHVLVVSRVVDLGVVSVAP